MVYQVVALVVRLGVVIVFEMESRPDALALRTAFRAMEPTQVLVNLARYFLHFLSRMGFLFMCAATTHFSFVHSFTSKLVFALLDDGLNFVESSGEWRKFVGR